MDELGRGIKLQHANSSFVVVSVIHNFMVGYSTKCLIVKNVGELRNAAPPENGLFS